MDFESFRNYCLSKQMVTESCPFGPDVLVFKVGGKMFALTGLDEIELKINLKCDPEYALDLRERYEAIQPGYHMNKAQWNTVNADLLMDDHLLLKLIDHSYDLIVSKLPKKVQLEINKLN